MKILPLCFCVRVCVWVGEKAAVGFVTAMIKINVNIIPCTLSLTTQSDTRGIFIYLHFSYCFHVCSTFERIYELLIAECAGEKQQLSCVSSVWADYGKKLFRDFHKIFSFINLMESAENKASQLIIVPLYPIKILIARDSQKLSKPNVTLSSYHTWRIVRQRDSRLPLKRGSLFFFLSLSMKIIFHSSPSVCVFSR